MEANEAFLWRLKRTMWAWICLSRETDEQVFSRAAAMSALLFGCVLRATARSRCIFIPQNLKPRYLRRLSLRVFPGLSSISLGIRACLELDSFGN